MARKKNPDTKPRPPPVRDREDAELLAYFDIIDELRNEGVYWPMRGQPVSAVVEFIHRFATKVIEHKRWLHVADRAKKCIDLAEKLKANPVDQRALVDLGISYGNLMASTAPGYVVMEPAHGRVRKKGKGARKKGKQTSADRITDIVEDIHIHIDRFRGVGQLKWNELWDTCRLIS